MFPAPGFSRAIKLASGNESWEVVWLIAGFAHLSLHLHRKDRKETKICKEVIRLCFAIFVALRSLRICACAVAEIGHDAWDRPVAPTMQPIFSL